MEHFRNSGLESESESNCVKKSLWCVYSDSNGLFTLTETDSSTDSDSDSKSNGYIVLCRTCSHYTDSDSDLYSPFLYRTRIRIQVRNWVRLRQCKWAITDTNTETETDKTGAESNRNLCCFCATFYRYPYRSRATLGKVVICVPVVTIAVHPYRHLKIDLVVSIVGLNLPQVPLDSGTTQHNTTTRTRKWCLH